MGHPNSNVLQYLLNSSLLGNNKNSASISSISLDYASCKLAKSKVLPFPSHGSHASHIFDIIHSAVWEIAPIVSHAHYKYFVTFIDDNSHFTWVYFLRAKSEVFTSFHAFLAFINNQFLPWSRSYGLIRKANINLIRFNRSYSYRPMVLFFRDLALQPQQNGVAERKNHHLLDMVRAFLIESSVLSRSWVWSSVYLYSSYKSIAFFYSW